LEGHFLLFLKLGARDHTGRAGVGSLDLANDGVRGMTRDNVELMHHEELLSGILTSVDENGLLTSGMIREELGDIKNLSINDDPAVLLAVVLGNILKGIFIVGLRSGGILLLLSSLGGGGGG